MQHEPLRVLILDDPMGDGRHFDEILSTADFETQVVGDHASALSAVDGWQPSAIVVGLELPGREGQYFCAELAKRPFTTSVPIVLLGAGPNLLKPTAVVPAGLVATPVDDDTLVATVRRVTGQHEPASVS
jgi:DNA-binding response OmpR family regulator